ncbi:alpha/beta hydrolase [Aeromonas sp. Prich7-2]|nr:alpha/beta hydrolase [Aeromonas sp. Prich7-2]
MTTITRFYEVNRFKRALREILKNHSDKEVYVFCHSFGTFITVKAIEKLSSEELKKIKYIVLAGSVLKSSYNFSPILGKVRTSIPRTKNENFSHLISMGYQ